MTLKRRRIVLEVLVTVLMSLAAQAADQLNENCTVSVLNRTAQGRDDGSWILPFVHANIGLVRARATCLESGVTRTGESDLFFVPANGIVLPDVVLFRDTPIVAALSLTAPAQTVTVATTPWLTATEFSPELTATTTFDATSLSSPLHGPVLTKSALTVSQLFQRGKQLVEDNCADCITTANSPNELLDAIDMLKQALRRGYKDKAAIHWLLRVAYSNLSMPELSQKELIAIIKADPSDMVARTDWIVTLHDGDREIAELRKIVAETPKYSMAHYLLAEMFFAGRNLAEGTKSIRRWLDTGSPEEIADQSDGVFASLGVDELNKVLKADPTIYPAHAAIALQLVPRKVGKTAGAGDIQGAINHARIALAAAPPAVALHYENRIGQTLRTNRYESEATGLRREFAVKLKSAEDRDRDH